jgi:hypothetical protein
MRPTAEDNPVRITHPLLALALLPFTLPAHAESDAEQSARLCRNAVVTFASRDPLGENAREQCEGDRPAAHSPLQWHCVVDGVTEGKTLYAAEKDCFIQQ